MDTKEWFGEHAHTVRLFALIGGVVFAIIVLFDLMTQKHQTAASATSATAPTSPTSSLNPGETNISVFQDYSTHNGATDSPVTSNQYVPVDTVHHGAPPPTTTPATPTPTHTGGPVPVPTPHPSTTPAAHATPTYTVKSGDTLWSIAAAKLGSGFDWRELYNWNRSTVGSNPNLIYPGEKLALN